MKRTALVVIAAASLALPAVVSAQGGPGFLFRRPVVSIAFRTGYTIPRLGSDIFDFPLDSLTLSKSDFGGPYFGGEVAVRASERWDVALTAGWSGSRSRSEYRDWVDQNELPIEQTTTFATASGALGAKYYFRDRGRSIGRFAWVPAKVAPFAGAGLGVAWYEFEQEGDFVDFETLDVFTGRFRTSGHGAIGYVHGGADVSIGRQFFVTGEARYNLASAGAGGPFSDFDSVDLSGLQLLFGIAVRF